MAQIQSIGRHDVLATKAIEVTVESAISFMCPMLHDVFQQELGAIMMMKIQK